MFEQMQKKEMKGKWGNKKDGVPKRKDRTGNRLYDNSDWPKQFMTLAYTLENSVHMNNAEELKESEDRSKGQITDKQPIQCKKVLNIASGTDLSYLIPSTEDDQVTNTDRGDMLYLRFVIKHYELFKSQILRDLRQVGLNVSEKMEDTSMIVNNWFYKAIQGDMRILWEMVTKAENKYNINKLVKKEQQLYRGLENKYFRFGTVLDERGERKFDEIMVISGYNVPVLSDRDYAQKIYQLLKDDGQLIVYGNISCLKTNGIEIRRAKSGELSESHMNDDLFKTSNIEVDIAIPSQHTLRPDQVNKINKVIYTKFV